MGKNKEIKSALTKETNQSRLRKEIQASNLHSQTPDPALVNDYELDFKQGSPQKLANEVNRQFELKRQHQNS